MAYTNFRIFHDNFIDLDVLANYSVSSAKTSFPVTNVFNQQRRSKVWRSDGYFNITSSNNKIIFRETSGVDIVAYVSVLEYTSTTLFMAAVKQALELASGGSTFTVTQVNGRFNIASNGVGGTGIFELYGADANFTCSSLGFTTTKTGTLTYLADLIILHDEEFILFDMGVPANPDAFIMTDQRNGSLKISPNATLKLEANETRNFSSPSFTQTLTYDHEIIKHISDAGIATGPYRYWRIYFKDQQNPNGYIQLGACFLGNYMNPTGRAQFPLSQSYVDSSSIVTSEGGQIYSDIREQYGTYTVVYKNMKKEDIEAFDLFWSNYGVSKPFFVSLDNSAYFSSVANRRLILCYFNSAPTWSLIAPNYFEMSFSLREAL